MFDPEEYEIVNENASHYMYNCPKCIDRRGKEDDDGKFYWDKDKLLGHCFKCDAVGVIKSDKSRTELELQTMLSSLSKSIVSKVTRLNKPPSLNYESLFDPYDDQCKNYIDSRCPLYSEFAEGLDFRVFDSCGVAVPIYYKGKVVSYNVRYYTPKGKMKYYIPPMAKVPYSPTRVFCQPPNQPITIVEGYFDAIGAMIDGKENPIAIMGSSVTEYQIRLIRSIAPSKIYVYMDEWDLSLKVVKSLRGKIPTCGYIDIIPTNGEDPEDIMKRNMNKINSEEELSSLMERLNKLLEGINMVKMQNVG